MSEDRILRELGHLAQEEREAEKARLDERWDRLAAGTLTPQEEAELQALAESSPEARETYEAFRPLGAEFQARMVNEIAAELQKKESPLRKILSRILTFRSPTLRPVRWLTAVAATAAAGLLLLLRVPAMAPLPVYIAEKPSGGVQMFRGEEGPSSKPPVFTPGSTLKLVVRPQRPVTGPVEARAFQARGAEIVPWEPEPRLDVSALGVVRLKGTIGEEVPRRVWIVVGRPGKLPSSDDLLAKLRAGQTRNDHWQAVSADLRVEDQAPP